METYNEKLTDAERAAIENALDDLTMRCDMLGLKLANDDRAARAAEALAVYIQESKAPRCTCGPVKAWECNAGCKAVHR